MGFVSQTTKRALEASLKKLLLKKPLNKITINDITEDCGVNRMTFYYHFKDIYDLVDWILLEDATRIIGGRETYETWNEGLTDLLCQVKENKTLVLNVYRSLSREQIELYLGRMLEPLLDEFVERMSHGMSVRDTDKKFIVNFYKYALVGVALDWVSHDMKEEPEEITARLGILMRGDLKRALERFRVDCAPLKDD